MTDPPTESDADANESVEELIRLAYDDLRARARRYLERERADHTLAPTAVVHEAYARLAGQDRARWRSREHFESVAAIAMRRVLVDHARAKGSAKRGGDVDRVQVTLSDLSATGDEVDVLVLDEALDRLRALDPLQHRIVELRFFGGLGERAIAERLDVSRSTVQAEWRMAKAWLSAELRAASDDEAT